MSRAQSLAAAADYLFEAVNGLDGAGVLGASDQARGLYQSADALHTEIRLAAVVAHRAERPEFYDEKGRWVGRFGKETDQ